MSTPEPGPLLRSLAPATDAIEPLSIERLLADVGPLPWTGDDRTLALRLAYAVADPGVLQDLLISPNAVAAGMRALRTRQPIVVDVHMVEHGLDRAALQRLGVTVHCAIDDPDVIAQARARGITRAAQAMLAQSNELDGAIVAIGNAPTALLALLDLIDSGAVRPALVLGLPVGYVAAAESKAALAALDIPFVTLRGRRGGTPLAVSAVNTLLRLADAHRDLPGDHTSTGSTGTDPSHAAMPATAGPSRTAILLIGHGSREMDASLAMKQICGEIAMAANCIVESAFLQLIPPTVLEGISACVARGAEHITVMPYFLHEGRHVRRDLPALLDQAIAEHSGLQLSLARPLGFSDALTRLVMRRIGAAQPHTPATNATPPIPAAEHSYTHTHASPPASALPALAKLQP